MRGHVAALLFGAVALPVGSAAAQHQGHQMPGQTTPPAVQRDAQLVAACVQSQQNASTVADQASERLESARQTNNPADLRAAMDDLQAALTRMKTLLRACASLSAPSAEPHGGHAVPSSGPAPAGVTPKAPTPADPHAGHTMPAEPAAPGAKPAAPAAPMDHSKMPMGGSESKAGEAKLPVTPAERVMDPACPTADTRTAPKATYQGKVYYFCSTRDRDEFQKDPAAYLKKRPRG